MCIVTEKQQKGHCTRRGKFVYLFILFFYSCIYFSNLCLLRLHNIILRYGVEINAASNDVIALLLCVLRTFKLARVSLILKSVTVACEGSCSVTTDTPSNKTYCTNSAIIIHISEVFNKCSTAPQCNTKCHSVINSTTVQQNIIIISLCETVSQ